MSGWDIYSMCIKTLLDCISVIILSPIRGAFDPVVLMTLIAGAA